MRKLSTIVAACVCLTVCLGVPALAGEAAGPPTPVPYKRIVDPPDDAERHIVVRAKDRGPVWLLTGFLSAWDPSLTLEHFTRVKTKYWRYDMWPLWQPSYPDGYWQGSPVEMGKYLDAVLRLREQGMALQTLVCWRGPFAGRRRITSGELEEYGEHIYTLVKYARHMGLPVDYWEVWNEPTPGPYEGVTSGFWRGTWKEFLDMWDTTYDAIRRAYPEAKIVGPSYGSCNTNSLEPFLTHCREKGQKLDVLSWHECEQRKVKFGPEYTGEVVVAPDLAHKNIMDARRLVEEKYGDLRIEEYDIGEWGHTIERVGPGTHIAYFHYFDLAGVDRAARSNFVCPSNMDGLLVSPKTPRSSYWCWVEYAKQDGGVRLVTETNDRGVVALASRHDDAKELRALVARSKRHYGEEKLPPVKVRVDLKGVPLEGKAEVTILRLGPHAGPMWEDEYNERAKTAMMDVVDGKLTVSLDDVAENEVISILIGPEGTRTEDKQRDAQWSKTGPAKADAPSERELHRLATEKGEEAAKAGTIRIACGSAFACIDTSGRAWFADREYAEGGFGHVGGGSAQRGPIKIEGTNSPEIYRTELWGQKSYHITLPNGKYLLRLHWAETYGANRKFDVTIEGETVLKDFNPLKEASGRNKAFFREFNAQVKDGVLDIEFPHKGNTPMINGIEVTRK